MVGWGNARRMMCERAPEGAHFLRKDGDDGDTEFVTYDFFGCFAGFVGDGSAKAFFEGDFAVFGIVVDQDHAFEVGADPACDTMEEAAVRLAFAKVV